MIKAITSKELRTNFPKIKKMALKGTDFIVYYRSKPILELKAHQPSPQKQQLTLADLRAHTIHSKNKKTIDAAELIRKERDE